jgi:hypothetical protein
MRIIAVAIAGVFALGALAAPESALAKSHSGYTRQHARHYVHHHRHRYKLALHAPYSGPAFTLSQKRYEEPQWNPYDPYGYGTAFAPD